MRALLALVAIHCSSPAAPDETWCTLRVARGGLYLDGAATSSAAARAACRTTAGAIVVLEDDAPRGRWETLAAELRSDGIAIRMRGTLDDNACARRPLAMGCP